MIPQKRYNFFLNPLQFFLNRSDIQHHLLSKVQFAYIIHQISFNCQTIIGEQVHEFPYFCVFSIAAQAGLQFYDNQTLEVHIFAVDVFLPEGAVLQQAVLVCSRDS